MTRTKTKAANGFGSIRKRTVKRKNGKNYEYWEARITIGTDQATTKLISKTITGKTQAEVIAKLRECKQSSREEPQPNLSEIPQKSMKVSEWMTIWVAEYLTAVKPSTAYIYQRDAALYIVPALGDLALSDLSAAVVQRFYNRLLHPTNAEVKPLSPKSVKCIHGVLHEALDQAVANGELAANPTSTCKLPKVEKREFVALESSQVATFLEAIEGHTHEYLFKIALFTGLRQGELLGLTWDCIDFDKATLTVKQQLRREQKKGGEYYFSSPKNGKRRVLTLAPSVVQLFKFQKQKLTLDASKAGNSWIDKNLVFTNPRGSILSYRTVYDCFKRVVAQMGIPEMRFRDLRHSFAVISLRSGDDIKTLQSNLGHASAAFTLDVYGHVTEDMKKASADRMESFIKAVEKL